MFWLSYKHKVTCNIDDCVPVPIVITISYIQHHCFDSGHHSLHKVLDSPVADHHCCYAKLLVHHVGCHHSKQCMWLLPGGKPYLLEY